MAAGRRSRPVWNGDMTRNSEGWNGNGAFAMLALMLFVVIFFATSATVFAQDTPARDPIALDVRIAGDDTVTRIVVEFDQAIEVSHRLLENPWRLVLDFGKIGYGFDEKAINRTGLVSAIRYGDMSESSSRVIFQARHPFLVRDIAVRNNAETGRHNLVIDLEVTSEEAFAKALDRSLMTSSVVNTAQKRDRLGASRGKDKTFKIIIDPGHGGIDNGARGTRGTLEKDVTLQFAEDLRDQLQRYNGAETYMTRESDVFVSLADRTGFARQHEADLFISIHADFLRQNDVRGATVYTISEKASDAVAESIADDQNLADWVAGVELPEAEDGVADILVDLARRETLGFSVQFARLAIADMRGFARLIKNPHRFAGFRVLTAPDVPSVLLELGYLSNVDDEKLMKQHEWRRGFAERLAMAIEKFAALSSKRLAAGPADQ
jgi:N-acetylmuramoyl-L-alanine amidase